MKRAFPVMAVLFCCMIFCMTGCGSSEKSDSGAKEEKTVKKQEQQNSGNAEDQFEPGTNRRFCSLLMYMGNSIQ